jgi:hypothetical protein
MNAFFFSSFSYSELQTATGEWMNEYASTPPRRSSITNEYIPASDILRKTIKKSWSMNRKYATYDI